MTLTTGFTYLGEDSDIVAVNLRSQVAKKLFEPLRRSSLLNMINSLPVLLCLKSFTAVGTVMLSREHFPVELSPKKSRDCEVDSSVFVCKYNITMVFWCPERSGYVVLLSALYCNIC